MTDYRVTYIRNADTLNVKKEGEKIHESLNLGDVTVDFDNEGHVIGIEILNASENIFVVDDELNIDDILNQVNNATIQEKHTENGFQAVLFLYESEDKEERMAMVQQNGPSMMAPSAKA
ncbi:MAG: DUF2283 domain-containing protein [Candidatus Nanohaloarchaea archaeon]|nr:DUF2283 domain-containing protein [Candidatus Nanohaloarchaea archaeon]